MHNHKRNFGWNWSIISFIRFFGVMLQIILSVGCCGAIHVTAELLASAEWQAVQQLDWSWIGYGLIHMMFDPTHADYG
jgi:hypothetical protein